MSVPAEIRKKPNLNSVTTINPDGSRYFLHPADVHGRFTFWRRLSGLLLIGIYVALPWIPVNGYPAVFLDLMHRRFHFFGVTFAAQDAWLLFFVITGLAFSLFYVTALWGRLWCGWTCPYTVFLEHIYRRIERWIDGDAPNRRRLEREPRSFGKLTRRLFKHSLYILVSAALAHIFLSYFVSLPGLYAMMQESPAQNARAFGVVLFFTGGFYFAFAWFREQFCIILCPYGRFQSVLTDEHTVVIGYDTERGEPRGKASNPGAGDCIDCNRCVQVCPTGIDIRNGLQIECIGCAGCVDACGAVMGKLGRAPGLVRYDSLRGFQGQRSRWIRPRTLVYTSLLLVGLVFMTLAISQVKPLRTNLVRMAGPAFILTPDTVRNHFQLRVINKEHQPARFRLELRDAPAGAALVGGETLREVSALGEELITVPVEVSKANYPGRFGFTIALVREDGALVTGSHGEFVGPHPRLVQVQPAPETPVTPPNP